jgi:hypothetical protein
MTGIEVSTAKVNDGLSQPAGQPTDQFTTRRLSASERLKRLARSAIGPSLYAGARGTYRMWQDAEERHAPFSLTEKLAAWRLGFHADSAAMYDFSRNDPRGYVNEYMRQFRCANINPCNRFFTHKLAWRSFLVTAGFPQAETVAVLAQGHVLMYPLDRERRRYVSLAEFERALIEDGGRFIVKPEHGERGKGIYLVEVHDGRLVRRRGMDTVPFRITANGRSTLVERMLVHHEFWRRLFPHSANTIRALTLWTPGDEAPFLARAAQRVGTVETMPTDNWSGGAVCAPIDLTTGRLGLALRNMSQHGRAPERHTHHPDSGARLEGAVLPFWASIRETVLRAAASLPLNRYVGWDIFVDETGTAIIIEANGNTGLQMVQVEHGLLTDPRIRRFYEKVGVV